VSTPIALDICCREGGATKGLQRAGFYVIGVDIEPRKNYPGDEFFQADGLKILDQLDRYGFIPSVWRGIVVPDLIWQSWPCQDGSTATASNRARGLTDDHRQFIPQARALSERIGIPYVLEQPASSRKGLIRRDLTLCMDVFKGELPPPWVQKHRSFEFGCWQDRLLPAQPKHRRHEGYVRGHRHGVVREGPYVAAYGKGGGKATTDEIAHAMGIDWMIERFDLCEAIPPAYSEYIGRAFLSGQDLDVSAGPEGPAKDDLVNT
jgi:hypothetical protein